MKFKLLQANWDSGVSITNIKHNQLISRNIQILLLDVDGTLLPRKDNFIHKSVLDWINTSRKHFKMHLISNNPSKKRISYIAKQLDLDFTFSAGKPSRKSIQKFLNNQNIDNNQVAIIGDRIFTDVIAGNRIGIYTILVKAIGSKGETIHKNITQIIENKVVKLLGA